MCDDGETYSDVLARILPEDATDADVLSEPDDEMVVISVTPEMHTLANTLAGESVPVRRVVAYYLFKHRLEHSVPPEEVLNQTFHRH